MPLITRFVLPESPPMSHIYELSFRDGSRLYVTADFGTTQKQCRLLLLEPMPEPVLTISRDLARIRLRNQPDYRYGHTRLSPTETELLAREFRREAAIFVDYESGGAELSQGAWLTVFFKCHAGLSYPPRSSPHWRLPAPLVWSKPVEKLLSQARG